MRVEGEIRSLLNPEASKCLEEITPGVKKGVPCVMGKPVNVRLYHLWYGDDEECLKDDLAGRLPGLAIELTDKNFKRQGISQIAVVGPGRGPTVDGEDQFVQYACEKAGCQGGANCLKQRRP